MRLNVCSLLGFGLLSLHSGWSVSPQNYFQESTIHQIVHVMEEYHFGSNSGSIEKFIEQATAVWLNNLDSGRLLLLQSEFDGLKDIGNANGKAIAEKFRSMDYDTYFKWLDSEVQRLGVARFDRLVLQIEGKRSALIEEAMKEGADRVGMNCSLCGTTERSVTEESLALRLEQTYIRFLAAKIKTVDGVKVPPTEVEFASIQEGWEKWIALVKEPFRISSPEGEITKSLPEANHNLNLRIAKAIVGAYDPHSSIDDEDERKQAEEQTNNSFFGIGAILKPHEKGVSILELIEGGPAALQGSLKMEDVITAVDGQSIGGVEIQEVVKKIKGPIGSVVRLTVERKVNGTPEISNIEITRGKVVVKAVSYKAQPTEGGIIGIIELTNFTGTDQTSEKAVLEAINKLKTQGELKGIILDLRRNGGGFLKSAVAVAGLFLDKEVIVTRKEASGEIAESDEEGAVCGGPLIVLTSSNTASASEIVAGALQDHNRAIIVGDERTFGKGSVQTIFDSEKFLVNKNKKMYQLRINMAYYYTPSGDSPQMKGVIPDIIVPGVFNRLATCGESTLPYPLEAPDDIAAAPLGNYHAKDTLNLLKSNSAKRQGVDPEFQKLSELDGCDTTPQSFMFRSLSEEGFDKQLEEAVHIMDDWIKQK